VEVRLGVRLVEPEEVVTGAVDAVESGVLDEPARGVGVR
jgi:hypothetical protein